MKFKYVSSLSAFLALLCPFTAAGQAQHPTGSHVYVPDSSVVNAADAGVRAHTNHLYLLPAYQGKPGQAIPMYGLGPDGGLTPSQVKSAYGLPVSGGSNIIALVDAYDDPTALKDFNTFSKQFRLPQETSTSPTAATNKVFQVIYAGGSKPAQDTGWDGEIALDIEWAHAMAPSAKIVLVEAASQNFSDLLAAVDVATGTKGVKEVSMSWAFSEFSTETSYDFHFPLAKGVVYFAATGDNSAFVGTAWPSTSPNVVAVGGTSLATYVSGKFANEFGWEDGGGGWSQVETRPPFQVGIANTNGKYRSVPDISAVADPFTGVPTYDSNNGGWNVVGGTSVSTPVIAGIVNLARHFYADSQAELKSIYSHLGTEDIRDITAGYNGYPNTADYDYVTGVGVPNGLAGL